MSRKKTGDSPVRIGIVLSWLASRTTEFTGTIGYLSSIGTLPEGLIELPLTSALITSSGDMPYDCSRWGSTVTTIVRALPPNGGGAETPGSLENIGRMRNSARSWISAID